MTAVHPHTGWHAFPTLTITSLLNLDSHVLQLAFPFQNCLEVKRSAEQLRLHLPQLFRHSGFLRYLMRTVYRWAYQFSSLGLVLVLDMA